MNLDIVSSYQKIKAQISSSSRSPVLIAVSKKQPIEKIETLVGLGQRDFGENYVQDLVARAKAFDARGVEDLRWHFMGHLQKNKVKLLLPWVDMIHSIDSVSLVQEIDKVFRRIDLKKRIKATIQVNIDSEESKSGFDLSELDTAYAKISRFPSIELVGLMCIPRVGNSESAFSRMRDLSDRMKSKYGEVKLSMGMSSDYPIALQYGADYLRLGTVLFGERP